MGAWTLGRDMALQPAGATPPTARQVTRATPSDVSDANAKLAEFAGRLLTWIPSDVVVFYTAAITALVTKPSDDAALWLTIGGVIAALVMVPLARFANSADSSWRDPRTVLRAVMAAIAFAIWSATVPNSGWDRIDWLAEDPARTAVLCGFAGLIFSLVASGIDKRMFVEGEEDP